MQEILCAGVTALLSAYPLVLCCIHQFLSPCQEVLVQGTSAPRAVSCKVPPPCCIDVDRLRVSHADIRVTHPSETSGSLPALHRGCLLGCGHRSCAGHVPAKPAPSALPKQSVHAGKTSTRQDLDVGHSVFPVYARRIILRWKVSSLLSCLTHSPCLAAIQQCAEDTGVVNCHLCFHSQHGIYPHTSHQAGESCSCLSDPLVDMYRYVKGEVVGDGGAKVHKLTDSIKFVVVDGDDWQCLCVLCQDVRLLQADGQLEVFAGLRETVHQRLEFVLGVGRNRRVISKQHVCDEGFTYFCSRTFVLALRRAWLNSLLSDLVRR